MDYYLQDESLNWRCQAPNSYLLQLATLSPHKNHTVAIVNIGGHRGQAVPAGGVQSQSLHRSRASQRLVDVQATEVIIYGDWLEGQERTGVNHIERIAGSLQTTHPLLRIPGLREAQVWNEGFNMLEDKAGSQWHLGSHGTRLWMISHLYSLRIMCPLFTFLPGKPSSSHKADYLNSPSGSFQVPLFHVSLWRSILNSIPSKDIQPRGNIVRFYRPRGFLFVLWAG